MSMLDLPDIQGNIHRPYGRFGFPYSRHLLFHVADARRGRWFVDKVRHYVTSAAPWDDGTVPAGPGTRPRPAVALNIGITWYGLRALGLPTKTLRLMPDEFID